MLKPLTSSKWAAKYFPVLKIAGDEAMRAPVALNKAVCVIGRRLGVHLPLNSTKVSKVHALIVRQRGGVYIRDLASRNHVYVNDLPVKETELENGDAVRVGPYTLHCASGFGASPEEVEPATERAPSAPPATLQLIGESTGASLGARAILIGQRDDCELVLTDERVAPVHAVVFEMDGKRFLRDLNSSAGTFVNNQPVHQHELEAGDEIRIGRARIRYEVEGVGNEEAPRLMERAIDLSKLDREDDLISIDDEELEDPADHPLSEPMATPANLRERIALEGVIDEGAAAVAVEPVCPEQNENHSPDVVSIPMPTRGGLEWTQPDRPAPLQPLPGVEPGFEEGGDDPDQRDAAQLAHPFAGEEEDASNAPERPDGKNAGATPAAINGEAAQKLDQIVSELSDKVAELETTWKESRENAG